MPDKNKTNQEESLHVGNSKKAVGGSNKSKKKKNFLKRSDFLVLAICLVVSTIIWSYASNLQKNEADKEISKEDIEQVKDKLEEVENKVPAATADTGATTTTDAAQ